ncbi:MAG: beta-ketoacyl-[acyl-carrier-protein] synthase family protein, partial [Planctomycetes bacterium]|nr:beta-ketoacyl-[acyl-carrier-protein] synthase family protein [Planctomycetota bacterium]
AVISSRYGLYGASLSTAAACATGLLAVIRAVECIHDGHCDVMFAGCADASLDRFTVSGFRNMRVLAEGDNPAEALRPFDRQRRGFAIGEGAAMFVLESMSHAVARRAPIYAVVAAGISGGDAYHLTSLNPDPSNLAWQISKVLHRAGVSPDEVDYINAHGTGTVQNDLAEAQAIRTAFGPAAARVRLSAVKSMIGHLLTAAGGVELAITALAVRDGFVPPTINLTDPDPECGLDCTPLRGIAHPIRTALKLSIAFGGHFGAAVLRHPACYELAGRIAA